MEKQFANWWSKALFKKRFDDQFFIPIPPPRIESLLMKSIERLKFNADYSHIKIDRPIFIVGLPRSGTTLLYNLLCAHDQAGFVTNSINAYPDAICAIEWMRKALNLNIKGERFFRDSVLTDFGSPSEPILFWGKWFGRDVDSLYWPEKRINQLTENQIQTIYNDIRKVLFSFGGEAQRFVCKYPVIQTELRLLQDLFPDIKFIHIVRDGRYTANSLKKLYHISNEQLKKINHPNIKHIVPYPRVKNLSLYIDQYGAGSLETTARVWQDSIQLVQETKNDLNNLIEVKYEDILANPSVELQRIFDFCELSIPDENNITFYNEFNNIGKVQHTNNYGGFSEIESIIKPTLNLYGYL